MTVIDQHTDRAYSAYSAYGDHADPAGDGGAGPPRGRGRVLVPTSRPPPARRTTPSTTPAGRTTTRRWYGPWTGTRCSNVCSPRRRTACTPPHVLARALPATASAARPPRSPRAGRLQATEQRAPVA